MSRKREKKIHLNWKVTKRSNCSSCSVRTTNKLTIDLDKVTCKTCINTRYYKNLKEKKSC